MLYKGVETSLADAFKNLEGSESPKRTIFASGGLGLLQMISESDTRRCVSKEAEPRKGWT